MKLTSIDGSELELTIKGYEFPAIASGDDDWLLVTLKAKTKEGSWEKTEPCMQPDDARRLIRWLKRCANRKRFSSNLEFLEPYIRFNIVDIQPEYLQMRAYLEETFRPPWNPAEFVIYDDEQSYFIDLKVTSAILEAAAISFRAEADKFP